MIFHLHGTPMPCQIVHDSSFPRRVTYKGGHNSFSSWHGDRSSPLLNDQLIHQMSMGQSSYTRIYLIDSQFDSLALAKRCLLSCFLKNSYNILHFYIACICIMIICSCSLYSHIYICLILVLVSRLRHRGNQLGSISRSPIEFVVVRNKETSTQLVWSAHFNCNNSLVGFLFNPLQS